MLTRWPHGEAPNDELLEARVRREGMTPRWWSNAAGDIYASHTHDYHKVLFCAEGSVTFVLGHTGERLQLNPGDRLDLPAGWPHTAIVGPAGVRCVEGSKGGDDPV
jgi:quercetin dioxygenase-like cupin family protein